MKKRLDNVCMWWYIVCKGAFLFAPRQRLTKPQTRTQGGFGGSEREGTYSTEKKERRKGG